MNGDRTLTDSPRYRIEDLLYLMQRLRDPVTGCPWDLRQTFASIAPFTLEETCEVIDAIERGDHAHLSEELGDLLFQVVFHSQLGADAGLFQFGDVVHQIVAKLVERHPHVFPEGTLHSRRQPGAAEHSVEAIKQAWETIKQRKRDAQGNGGRLADVPLALPALTRAAKLQRRAAGHGFDWPDVAGVFAKIDEEMVELKAAIASGDRDHIDEEVGDLLFCCVNLARHLQVDGEGALRRANRKFERRFAAMEALAVAQQRDFALLDIDELNELWRQAKVRERRG